MSGKTMDSLVWLSMWLADRGMERERESIHKLHACLLAVGLDAEPHDLEPRPEEAGACLLPAQKPDMAGLWAQVVHRGYALRNILRGRARVRALAACLAGMAERGRELAWCVEMLVLWGAWSWIHASEASYGRRLREESASPRTSQKVEGRG